MSLLQSEYAFELLFENVVQSCTTFTHALLLANPIHLHTTIDGLLAPYIRECSDSIYDLYLKCLSFGFKIPFNNKNFCIFRSDNKVDYRNRRLVLTRTLNVYLKKNTNIEQMPITAQVMSMFKTSSLQKQLEIVQTLIFEQQVFAMKMVTCGICKKKALSEHFTMKMDEHICDKCASRSNPEAFVHDFMPTWTDDDGRIRHDLPEELKDLTLGEMMLIQLNAILIPLTNMWKGSLGLSGHSCMFHKDIMSVVNELPRKNVEMLNMLRDIESKDNPGEVFRQVFKIRRTKVLKALRWLKKYHIGYRDIIIVEDNLSWMKGQEEGILSDEVIVITKTTDKETLTETSKPDERMTVSETQTMEVDDNSKHTIEVSSTFIETSRSNFSTENAAIAEELKKSRQLASSKIPLLDFPQIDDEPIDEYNTPRMLANAYPWLFPGGVGDMSGRQYDKKMLNQWTETLLHYHDGRFMRDKVFSFHLFNIIQRHGNNRSSYYFVRDYISDPGVTVEDVKQQVKDGNTAFVSKLQNYASGKIRGSDPWWRSKKNELESWLAYHLEQGDGPPTLFLTLSCAEYWWKDLERLLFDKCQGTEDEELANRMINDKSISAKRDLLNKYAAVVQEFFQIRVDIWLETVGKETMGITHYWFRFEFTKGRGQIHAHILAITEDTGVIQAYHLARNETEKMEIISEYAREKLGMTAQLPPQEPTTDDAIPSLSTRYCELTSESSDYYQLCSTCHMHKCNGFCMRNYAKR